MLFVVHHFTQVLDHVMVGIEGITKELGHHLIRERCASYLFIAKEVKCAQFSH